MNGRADWMATIVSVALRLALFGVGAVLSLGYLFFAGTAMTTKSGQFQIIIGICCFVAAFLPPWNRGRVATTWTIIGAIAAIVLGVAVTEWIKGIVTTSHLGYLLAAVVLGIGIAGVTGRKTGADRT